MRALIAFIVVSASGSAFAQVVPGRRMMQGVLAANVWQPWGTDSQELDSDLIVRHAPAAPRELVRNFEQAEKLIAERKWPAAIDVLQFIIEQPEDSLLMRRRTAPASVVSSGMAPALFRLAWGWRLEGVPAVLRAATDGALRTMDVAPVRSAPGMSSKRRAEILLATMPEEGRRTYLNSYTRVAADLLAAARQRQDFEGLCDVAKRFWNTPAGQAAGDEIATLLRDDGDSAGAAIWMAALYADDAPLTRNEAWRRNAASLWRELGQADAAQNLEAGARLETPPPPPGKESPTTSRQKPAGHSSLDNGPPLLLEDWHAPLAQHQDVIDQIHDLKADLLGNHVAFPAIETLGIGNRVAVRTLAGICVHDSATGELLYRNDDRTTAESLLTAATEDASLGAGMGRMIHRWDDPDMDPLTSLLFRDSVLGRLSTDGSRLFAIERRAPLISDNDEFDARMGNGLRTEPWDHSINLISAYDLATGRRVWTIGGPVSDEPFAPALTGVYFFGPPVADGRELFVVGAAMDDINLYCLEATTGQPLWSQRIAQYDNVRIENDSVRQMWACPPRVTAGLVLCPTNAGWLTAVDRLRRRITWCARYGVDEVSFRYQPTYSLESIDHRWPAAAPIIAGATVVVTPLELPDEARLASPQMVGINILDGTTLWRRDKESILGIAGVVDHALVTIGREEIAAWPLSDDPTPRWRTRYPAGLLPSGQGAIAEGNCWIPFEEGVLMAFRLSDGKAVATLRSPEIRGRLGNLAMHGDRMVSSGPAGISSFWRENPLEATIRLRLEADPHDAEARLLSARRMAAQGDWPAALQDLSQTDWMRDSISATLRNDALELRWTGLTTLLKENPGTHDAEWAQLQQAADDDAKRRLVEELAVDRALARRNWDKALDACWTMLASPEGDIQEEALTVTRRAWLGGRLAALREQSPPESRAALDERVKLALSDPALAPRQRADNAQQVFAFHPEGQRWLQQAAEASLIEGRIFESDVRSRRLSASVDSGEQAMALQRLTRQWETVGSLPDARLAAQRLAACQAAPLSDGTDAVAWAENWLNKHPQDADPTSAARWTVAGCELIRSGMEYGPGFTIEVLPQGHPAKWFASRRLAIESAWDGLVSVDERTGQREWLVPLPAAPGYDGEPVPTITSDGAVLILCFRGVVHALSPIERRELWTWSFPPRFVRPIEYDWGSERPSGFAEEAEALQGQFQTHGVFRREGPLLAIGGGHLVVLGQRELVVIDLLTGQRVWRRAGMTPLSTLAVDGDSVCVSNLADREDSAAFRLSDGGEISADKYHKQLERSVAVLGDRLVTVERTFSLFARPVRLSAVSPRLGKTYWRESFPAGTLFSWGLENELIAIQPDGAVAALDCISGARTELGRIPEARMGEGGRFHAVADRERVYIAVNTAAEDFSYLSLPCIRVQGDLYAFDRSKGGLAWPPRTISGSNLVLNQLRRTPVLIFASYQTDALSAGGENHYVQKVELMLLDKSTGAEVLRWSGPTIGGSPSAMSVDPALQRIDLLSFNERYRLQFRVSRPSSSPAR